jgi:Raf kinase inhibitor-like YbhB/YbcL family protein
MLPAVAGHDVPVFPEAPMELSSSSIPGGRIAKPHACRAKGGSDQAPQLTVREIPGNARFLAIVADDPDAVKPAGQVWVHWNVFNIPAGGNNLEVAAGQPVPGGEVGRTTGHARGYEGMCPPDGVHTYRFAVFGLKDRIRIDADTPWTIDAFEAAHGSQVVAKAVISGQF